MNTFINGIGIYLPSKIYTSEEVERKANYEKFGIKHGIVKMITGVNKRHYAGQNELSSDIAAKAAIDAFKNSKVKKEDIDGVLFCSVTQDFAEPATANVVAEKIGLENIFAFDIKNGCNAFLSGIDVADSLIQTGKAKNILICSGEAISKWIKFNYSSKKELMEGSPVTLSLGDGGGAFILSQCPQGGKGILKTHFETYPELWNNNVMWGGGVAYPRDPDKMYIPGTTKPLVDKQIFLTKKLIKQILDDVNWNIEDVDYIIPSQVASWIISAVQKELEIPSDRFCTVLKKWGNVASSNIPLATYEAWKKGKLNSTSKVIFVGGAVGFSACVMAVQF